MMDSRTTLWLAGLVLLVCLTTPAFAFGAGNISSKSAIEGINWRHGDIEDALLGIIMARAMNKKNKTFNKVMVARVYFGNWLRDYSQAVDLGTIKNLSYEAIRLVVSILAFMAFGFGSKEFEVTPERLGCYRPEEHIDSPKGYADGDDARRYWHGLRGPVDEHRELSIDPDTGMKNYIANEELGIDTSAGLLHKLLGRCIELGRGHARDKNDDDLYEAMRLMGAALHCLEDFFAHSNYIELALIEMGEREVFPHVGRDTRIELEGARRRVWPLVTGTFGEVDFLHSVAGEVSDKLKQNEMQELEQYLQDGKKQDTSLLKRLLDMIPDSLFGGEHQSNKMDEIQQNCNQAQMENLQVQPHREPEEITIWVGNIFRQIVPIMEWHDRIMKIISDALPTIPILPKIIEQLEDQLNAFVTAQIAPFVVPVIQQIQNEMNAGSNGIIETSKRDQHVVFNDDESTDPTHSMLSKDHFTNLLNEPAGKTASEMVKWVVPQIMDAIDDESIDSRRTIDRIISGVLHHPAQRHMGRDGAQDGRDISFKSVEAWWNGMSEEQQEDYRRRLSRDGVLNHENHKEGEYDTGHGHGCLGKLEQNTQHGGKKKKDESWEDKIATHAADAIVSGVTGAFSNIIPQSASGGKNDGPVDLLGGVTSFLGNVLGVSDDKRRNESSSPSFGGRQEYGGSSYERPSSRHEQDRRRDDDEHLAYGRDHSQSRPSGGESASYYNTGGDHGGGDGDSGQQRHSGYGGHHEQHGYGGHGGHPGQYQGQHYGGGHHEPGGYRQPHEYGPPGHHGGHHGPPGGHYGPPGGHYGPPGGYGQPPHGGHPDQYQGGGGYPGQGHHGGYGHDNRGW